MIRYAIRLGIDKPMQRRKVTLRQGEVGNARFAMHVYQGGEEIDLSMYDVALCVMPHGYAVPCSVDERGEVSCTVPRGLTQHAGLMEAYLRLSYDDTDNVTTQTFEIEVLEGVTE